MEVSRFGDNFSAFNPDMPIDWKAHNRGVTPEFFVERVELFDGYKDVGKDANGNTIWATCAKTPRIGADGKPLVVEVEMVILRIAGDGLAEACAPVDDALRERFSEEYAAWKEGRETAQQGHTLEEWPPLFSRRHGDLPPPKLLGEMHGRGLYTVEDLAAVSDSHLGHFHGDRVLRDKAIAWLADKERFAVTDRLAGENALQATRIEALERQIAKLTAAPKRKKQMSGAMRKRLNAERVRKAPVPASPEPPASSPA